MNYEKQVRTNGIYTVLHCIYSISNALLIRNPIFYVKAFQSFLHPEKLFAFIVECTSESMSNQEHMILNACQMSEESDCRYSLKNEVQ